MIFAVCRQIRKNSLKKYVNSRNEAIEKGIVIPKVQDENNPSNFCYCSFIPPCSKWITNNLILLRYEPF